MFRKTTNQVAGLNTKLDKVRTVKLAMVEAVSEDCLLDLGDLKERWGSLQDMISKVTAASGKVGPIKSLKDKILGKAKEIANLEEKKKEFMNTMEVCPLCSSPLT